MKKIISVTPIDDVISLSWMIGARCNYDCVYCPAELHDTTSKHPDLKKLVTVWNNFYEKTSYLNLPYKIGFTGGEVTANKSFLPLVKYLRENNFNIKQLLVTTNGSASQRYYQNLTSYVDAISFSTHSEFFNEKEFFTKAKAINELMVRPQKSFHVNIMDEYWNKDRIEMYKIWLEQNHISYSVNSINYSSRGNKTIAIQGVKNFEQL